MASKKDMRVIIACKWNSEIAYYNVQGFLLYLHIILYNAIF
jgi:hypothetical protein